MAQLLPPRRGAHPGPPPRGRDPCAAAPVRGRPAPGAGRRGGGAARGASSRAATAASSTSAGRCSRGASRAGKWRAWWRSSRRSTCSYARARPRSTPRASSRSSWPPSATSCARPWARCWAWRRLLLEHPLRTARASTRRSVRPRRPRAPGRVDAIVDFSRAEAGRLELEDDRGRAPPHRRRGLRFRRRRGPDQGPSPHLADRGRGAAPPARGRRPAAPGAPEPARQRDQVHALGNGGGAGRRRARIGRRFDPPALRGRRFRNRDRRRDPGPPVPALRAGGRVGHAALRRSRARARVVPPHRHRHGGPDRRPQRARPRAARSGSPCALPAGERGPAREGCGGEARAGASSWSRTTPSTRRSRWR